MTDQGQHLQHFSANHSNKSLRQELLESDWFGSRLSNENVNAAPVELRGSWSSYKRGTMLILSVEVRLERGGEKGGEGEGDEEKQYFWPPGPTLTGRGDGGVGGDDDGDEYPSFISLSLPSSSSSSPFSLLRHLGLLFLKSTSSSTETGFPGRFLNVRYLPNGHWPTGQLHLLMPTQLR